MLDLFQILLTLLLIALILLQQRGAEGGALFGLQTEFFFKKRGLEKNLYYLTWFLIFVFVFISLLKVI